MIRSRIFDKTYENSSELIQCGEENCSSAYEFGGIRSYYLVHMIKEGKGEFYSCGKRWKLQKGDAFFIFPETQNLYKADELNPWHYFWIAFKGNYNELLSSVGVSPDYPVLHTSKILTLYKRFEAIFSIKNTGHPGDFLEMMSEFHMILSDLFKEKKFVTENIPLKGDIKARHVENMLVFIDTHYNSPIKVHDIIKSVHLERTYAAKLFKNTKGISIGRYLKEIRMNKAEEYLKRGWSVKETAYSVGYNDYENFLKSFKKFRGMTPGEFKRVSL